MPHEKPLAIQLRRLLQAGYNDADRVDEMGRENLAMLCRFIYQPPILPIIDPVSTPRRRMMVRLSANSTIHTGG